MGESSASTNICVNCGYDFHSENQIRTKRCSFPSMEYTNLNEEFSETEIQIVDAISQVFGLSFQDLFPEKDFGNEIPIRSVVLCSECTLLMEKLYDSFHGMKKMSHDDNSILWNSVNRKRSKIGMKTEIPLEGLTFPTPQNIRSSELSRNVKREIDTDNYDSDENELRTFSDDFIGDNDYGRTDLKPVIKNRMVKKSGKMHRRNRKKVLSSRFKIKEEQETTIQNNRSDNLKEKESLSWKKILKRKRLRHRKYLAKKDKTGNETLPWNIKHLDSLSGAVPIKCCNTSFQTEVDFISHVNLDHKNESELSEQECQFCQKKILSKYMQFHINVLHQGKLMVYECSVCKKTFLNIWRLTKHKTKEHKQFVRKNWSHLGIVRDGSKVFCDKCGKYFRYKYFINYHLPSVHKVGEIGDQIHQCDICGQSVKSARYLKVHMSRYHSANSRKCCDICGKISPSSKALIDHKRIHEADLVTDKERFKCTQCGIILKHSIGLERHTYRMHGKAALKSFSCELCGKKTKTMTNMRIHMKVHNKQNIANVGETLSKAPETVSAIDFQQLNVN